MVGLLAVRLAQWSFFGLLSKGCLLPSFNREPLENRFSAQTYTGIGRLRVGFGEFDL
jgi:hypothetical protein